MRTSRFTDSQIIAILKQAEAGSPVPELCREHGISNATFYKWRSKFSGMDALLMARMKELKEENRRLKKMYVEERLKAEIFAEALSKIYGHPPFATLILYEVVACSNLSGVILETCSAPR